MVNTNQLLPIGFVALFVLIGLILLIAAIGRFRAWWRLKSSGANAPGRLNTGHTEVEGTARPLEKTLTSPHEEAACLVYEHKIEEREIDHDPDGGTQRRWRTVTDETHTVPFILEGEYEEAVVDPAGATNLLETSVSTRSGDRRTTITRLDVGEPVYVAGEAVRADEADVSADGQPHVVRGPSTWVPNALRRLYEEPFVISDAKEGTAERRMLWGGVKTLGVAVLWLGITGAASLAVLGETGIPVGV
jgi:hypothetical protein